MDLDEQLDERLHAAAPPIVLRTPEIRRELDALVALTMPTQRPRRRTIRATVVAGAVAGTLGLATVASAAGLLPGWALLTTGSGQTCEVRVAADALAGDGEPGRQFSATEQAKTLASARAFLHAFDYDSIDRDEAIATYQAEEDAVITAQQDPAERQPRLEGDDLEVTAVSREVTERLGDYLEERGLDLRAVDVSWQADGCRL
jgi:hypothetical protein